MTTKDAQLSEYRIGELEKNYNTLNDKVEKIMTNHLPHLQAAVQSLTTRINVTTAINVGAIITGILVAKYVLR